MFEVGSFPTPRSSDEGNGLVFLGGHHVLVGSLAHRVDMWGKVLDLTLLEHLPDLIRVHVQVLAGVDCDHGGSGVGLYEVIDISLSQGVKYRALVQISKQ